MGPCRRGRGWARERGIQSGLCSDWVYFTVWWLAVTNVVLATVPWLPSWQVVALTVWWRGWRRFRQRRRLIGWTPPSFVLFRHVCSSLLFFLILSHTHTHFFSLVLFDLSPFPCQKWRSTLYILRNGKTLSSTSYQYIQLVVPQRKKLTNQICRRLKNYSFVSCWLCDAQNKLWHVWQTDSLVFCVLQLVLCVCLFVIAFLINTIVLGSSDIIQHYFNHVEQQQKNDLFHPFSEPIRDAAFTEQKFSNQRLKP